MPWKFRDDIPNGSRVIQGRSDWGEYRYLYPPKSAQVNFLWGKNDVRTAIQQFYTPKKLYTPKTNLATPLVFAHEAAAVLTPFAPVYV